MNLPALDQHIEEIGAGMVFPGKFEGRTLFIIGAKSNYFRAGDEKVIHEVFPKAELKTLDTGHWVQAENPSAFISTVMTFLQTPD
jgi:pimeloyl-ACP methyl ester carboxylesterase